MTDNNQNLGMPAEAKPTIPSGINILTILTFIGCGLELLLRCYSFFTAKQGLEKLEEMINSGKVDDLPGFAKKFYTPEMVEMARKAYENRLPIFLITLVGIVLCLMGALQMRKLKKQGYSLYVVGELLPLVAAAIFLGISSITGVFGIIGICIALLFILLYAGQRKNLVN